MISDVYFPNLIIIINTIITINNYIKHIKTIFPLDNCVLYIRLSHGKESNMRNNDNLKLEKKSII